MKQTAVEWLKVTVKSMIENGEDADLYAVLWHIEQAREMEKHQILNTYIEASPKRGDILKEASERYYNETYNTNEK